MKRITAGCLVAAIPGLLIAQDTGVDLPVDPGNDIPVEGPPADVQDYIDSLEILKASFLDTVQGEYDSAEDRAAAIQTWLVENVDVINGIDAAQAEVDLASEGVNPEDVVPSARPEASENMVDLESLLAEKLALVEADNETLSENLAAAEADLETRLEALKDARDSRLADMEAARNLARQKRDEARSNSQGDRRADDDLPEGIGG